MSVVQPPARPGVQVSYPNEVEHRRQLALKINQLNNGQVGCTLFVTLDPGVTSTKVVDARISQQTCVFLQPQTADAASALGTTFVTCTNGSATITHAASAETDRIYTMGMVG
jgi:hypothetical protein